MRRELLPINQAGFLLLSWRYHFNWRITLFSIVCVSVFVHLSVWQFERADEKHRLQEEFDARRQSIPVELSDLEIGSASISGQNVWLKGSYLADQSFLLDNRVLNGKVGFEVISPLLIRQANWDIVLVNRGWIEMGRTREDHVDIGTNLPEVVSKGSVYVPQGEMYSLQQDVSKQSWPALIQQLDVPRMISSYSPELKVFPYIVRLDEGEIGAYPRFWPILNMRPEKHTGYAIQWMLMALAVVIAYGWSSFRKQPKENQFDQQ